MNIYRIDLNNSVSHFNNSVSIDPGIKTSGFCFLDKLTNNMHLQTFAEDMNMYSAFPEILCYSTKMTSNYINEMNKLKIDYSTLEFNIEYTFAQGNFAPGLNTQITNAISKVIELGVTRVNLVPAKIPGFFIRKNSVDNNFLKKWVEIYLPQFFPLCNSPHVIDALLISLYLNYDYYLTVHNNVLEIRKPEYDIIYLDNYIR